MLVTAINGSAFLETLVVPKSLMTSTLDVAGSPCAKRGGLRSKFTIALQSRTKNRTAGYRNSTKISVDGKRLYADADGDGPIGVWNLANGQLLMTLEGHTARLSTLLLSRDGQRLYSTSDDKQIRAWDVETGACEMIMEDHKDLVGQRLASMPTPRASCPGS